MPGYSGRLLAAGLGRRNEILLRNLRLGQSVVDLMLRRHDNDVSLQVLRNEGQIMVAAVYS